MRGAGFDAETVITQLLQVYLLAEELLGVSGHTQENRFWGQCSRVGLDGEGCASHGFDDIPQFLRRIQLGRSGLGGSHDHVLAGPLAYQREIGLERCAED